MLTHRYDAPRIDFASEPNAPLTAKVLITLVGANFGVATMLDKASGKVLYSAILR